MLSKHQRLELILERLAAAPPAANADEALALMATVMKAVEDAHSGVPDNPDAWQTDGRLYPPLADRRIPDPHGRTGVECRRSLAHYTCAGAHGAILIVDSRTGAVIFRKPGADGRTLPEAGR